MNKLRKAVILTLIILTPFNIYAWEVGDPEIDGWKAYETPDSYNGEIRRVAVTDDGDVILGQYLRTLSRYYWLNELTASEFRIYYRYKPLSNYGFNIVPYLSLYNRNLRYDGGESEEFVNIKKFDGAGYAKGWVDVDIKHIYPYSSDGVLNRTGFGLRLENNGENSWDILEKLNGDRSIFKAHPYYKTKYEIVDIGYVKREENGYEWKEITRTVNVERTNMYDYYMAMYVSSGYSGKGEVKITGNSGEVILMKTDTDGHMARYAGSLTPLNISSDQLITIETRATKYTEDDVSATTILLRKKKPGPKVSNVTRLTSSTVGENTKIRYRINTTTTYTHTPTIKAKLGDKTRNGTITGGSGYLDLEWDSSELGEGDFNTLEITVDNGDSDIVTTKHILPLNIKYTLKEATNNLIGQLNPKSNIQRTIVLSTSNRTIDNNITNRNIIDSLSNKLKAMKVDLYVVGPSNELWNRLSSKFK